MASLRIALCVLAIGNTWAAGVDGKDTVQASVVAKVIEMLQENKMKVASDLGAEEKEMAEYARFCDKESGDKGYAIKTAKRKISDLSSNIEDATAQIDGATSDIKSLGSEIASKESDLSGIEKVRASEKSDFEATEKELESSIGQLDKAIMMIKRSAGFLQTKGTRPSKKVAVEEIAKALGSIVDAAWVPRDSSMLLKGFLQQHGTEAADAELTLNADAKAQGGGIVGTLEDMKTKAEETLTAARQEEMKANHNFQMMKQSIVMSMDTLKEKLSDTKKAMAEETEGKGKANGELATVRKTMAADTIQLESLQRDCQQAAQDWEERQKSAKGEMAAIAKAVDILSKRVKLTQTNGDFLTGSEMDGDVDTSTEEPERRILVTKLRNLGHKFSSYALAELAGAAAQDPFGKVRTLIEDMVAKLVAEANEDMTQKKFCDEEKAKSGKEKEKKSMRADDLQNRLDTAESSKASLMENIKELQEEIAQIDASTKEATSIRAEESATAAKAAADFKGGAEAVTQAIRVLRDYYASAAALPQLAAGAKQPKLGGAKSDAAGMIISLLENSGEEFTKMYMQITADEEEAAAAYKDDMNKSKISKASKEAEVKSSETEIKSLDVSLEENGEDLKMTQKELDAVLAYIEKLKPQCEVKAMSFEEKAAKRQAEIEGLKEALTILDQGALVQTRKK